MTNVGRLPTLLILLSSLSGCAIPGMRMDSSSFQEVEQKQPEQEITPQLYQITPELISEERYRYSASAHAPESSQQSDDEYRIGAGDVLSVTVWDHPELTIPAGEFRSADISGQLVNSDGTIFYPYIGNVKVTGMTAEQVRKQLTDKLRHYVKNPQIDVRIAAFRSQKAFITGQILKPNVVPITDTPITVVEAINLAGGAGPDADLTDVRVTRNGKVESLNLLAVYQDGSAGNFTLQDGDQIYVPNIKDKLVFVLGEVSKPLAAPMINGHLNLAQALLAAGGVNEDQSNPSRIYVIRGGQVNPSIYQLDAGSADAMLLATAFELQRQDVVYVSPAAVSRWNRLIRQILPTVQVLWQTNNLIQTTK